MFFGSCLFQLFQNLIRTHTACQQLLQHCFGFSFLCFFGDLGIRFRLFCFQRGQLFFSFLQRCLLPFQISFQSIDISSNGSDLCVQRRNSLLLLRYLGCVVFGDIGFGTVFAAFRSWHGDNLFPFLVV